ncbi:hypothetical protein Nepgr_010102 [Nepenthes gracilis]|uniref:Pentatricopeptide repeat-containing protein n=1 Tax=Nepenthes gracilis TaxID=150966 RepID=A0AAD3XKR5_NEPGR|nr:hypothetical protein Nepgr_010102 [Nepenthes gracilis]
MRQFLCSSPRIASHCGLHLIFHRLLSSAASPSSLCRSPLLFPSLLEKRSFTFSLNSLIEVLAQCHKFLQSLFLFRKISTIRTSFELDPLVFPSLLSSCACLCHLNIGKSTHGFLIKCGFMTWDSVNIGLIEMYVKFGERGDAYQLFEEMPIKNERFCNSLVCDFGFNGFFEESLVFFDVILALGFFPYLKSVYFAVLACGELRRLDKGIWLYNFVIRNGFDAHVLIGNSLISMYIKMDRLDFACCAFNSMKDKDIVSWNSLITGFAQNGNWAEAFKTFLSMKEVGNLIPNRVTFLGLVLACGRAGDLDQGKSIHGHSIVTGLLSDFRLGTAIVDMYAKCNSTQCAQTVFQEGMFKKSLVSWNSLISGYSQNGHYWEAAQLFKNMITESNLKPDSVTFANVLPAYSGLESIELIKSSHALMVKIGLEKGKDVVLSTAVVDAYGKCLDVAAAKLLFTCIEKPNAATWNAMIAVYCLNHYPELGMLVFLEMLQSKVSPDAVTVIILLQLCGELGSLKQGNMAHCYSLSKGFSSHHTVQNTMIDMYMRCGSVENSENLFRLMPVKSVITWNTMLSGYVKIGSCFRTMKVFSQMLSESEYSPDSVTLISLIQAAGAVVSGHGPSIAHSFAVKLGLDAEALVINSLMDAYAKNGMIENARSLFMHMGQMRDQCSWNVMIAGYGINGQGVKACELVKQMEENGYKPDSITFTSVLFSCCHSGLIEEGHEYFHMMLDKYNIKPGLQHWTCIIDMLGHAGRLEEAHRLVVSQNAGGDALSDSDAIWGALLDASRMNMNLEVGELAGNTLSKLAPENCGYHILLSNLYASCYRWDEATKVRRVFEDRLTKKPGISLVQI